jgi:hypothetical protein
MGFDKGLDFFIGIEASRGVGVYAKTLPYLLAEDFCARKGASI